MMFAACVIFMPHSATWEEKTNKGVFNTRFNPEQPPRHKCFVNQVCKLTEFVFYILFAIIKVSTVYLPEMQKRTIAEFKRL